MKLRYLCDIMCHTEHFVFIIKPFQAALLHNWQKCLITKWVALLMSITTFKQIFIMCKTHNYHIIIIKSFKASLLHKWHTHTNVGKQQNKPPFLPMALLSSHYSNLNSAPGEHVGDIYMLNAKPAAFTQFAYRRSVIELQTFLFVLLPLGTTADSASSSSSYETASEHKQNTKAPQLGT